MFGGSDGLRRKTCLTSSLPLQSPALHWDANATRACLSLGLPVASGLVSALRPGRGSYSLLCLSSSDLPYLILAADQS